MSVGQPVPPPPHGNGPPAPPLWCGVGGGIPSDFHLEINVSPYHVMPCYGISYATQHDVVYACIAASDVFYAKLCLIMYVVSFDTH